MLIANNCYYSPDTMFINLILRVDYFNKILGTIGFSWIFAAQNQNYENF